MPQRPINTPFGDAWKPPATDPGEIDVLTFFDERYRPLYLANGARATLRRFYRSINRFHVFTGPRLTLAHLTEERLAAFYAYLRTDAEFADATAVDHMKAVQAIQRQAAADGLLPRPKTINLPAVERVERPRIATANPTPKTTLREFVEIYAQERAISDGYHKQLRWSADKFAKFLGRDVTLGELESTDINRWIDEQRAGGRTAATLKGQRNNIVTMWRYAFEIRAVDTEPKRIKVVRIPERITRAWTLDDIDRLLVEVDKMPGYFSRTGIKKAAWFRAFVYAGFDTGLRLSDLLSLRKEHYHAGETFEVIQAKTGWRIQCRLSDTTKEAVALTLPPHGPDRDLLFPLWGAVHQFYSTFRQLVRNAGLTGTSKFLRRSAATYVQVEHGPGAAMTFLGHKTPGLAQKHYVDYAIARPTLHTPPALPSQRKGGAA